MPQLPPLSARPIAAMSAGLLLVLAACADERPASAKPHGNQATVRESTGVTRSTIDGIPPDVRIDIERVRNGLDSGIWETHVLEWIELEGEGAAIRLVDAQTGETQGWYDMEGEAGSRPTCPADRVCNRTSYRVFRDGDVIVRKDRVGEAAFLRGTCPAMAPDGVGSVVSYAELSAPDAPASDDSGGASPQDVRAHNRHNQSAGRSGPPGGTRVKAQIVTPKDRVVVISVPDHVEVDGVTIPSDPVLMQKLLLQTSDVEDVADQAWQMGMAERNTESLRALRELHPDRLAVPEGVQFANSLHALPNAGVIGRNPITALAHVRSIFGAPGPQALIHAPLQGDVLGPDRASDTGVASHAEADTDPVDSIRYTYGYDLAGSSVDFQFDLCGRFRLRDIDGSLHEQYALAECNEDRSNSRLPDLILLKPVPIDDEAVADLAAERWEDALTVPWTELAHGLKYQDFGSEQDSASGQALACDTDTYPNCGYNWMLWLIDNGVPTYAGVFEHDLDGTTEWYAAENYDQDVLCLDEGLYFVKDLPTTGVLDLAASGPDGS